MGSGGKEKEPKQKKKPGRVPTSCAECRRLKLRCDRNVPCEKCVQRGCGSICPDGVLTPGKGNRLVLANTEQLHEQIEHISARNRELENALRKLQEVVSDQPHPLLETGLRVNMPQGSSSGPSTSSSSKSPTSTSRISPTTHPPESEIGEVKLDGGHHVVDAFGTLTIRRREESSFYGRTARPEYLAQGPSKPTRPSKQSFPRLSDAILAISFPEPETRDDSVLSDMLSLLPSQEEALNLCDLYLEYGKFLYSPMPRQLLDETLSVVYRAKKYTAFEHHHALALLFVAFAIATLFNPNKTPYSSEAHEYYYLARAAMLLSLPMQDATPTAIQTWIHMAQYLDLSDKDPGGFESAWMYLGHANRLAQSIGLLVNSARWKLPEDLVQKRHDLFWKLFVADTWTSLHHGRPSSISRTQIDCPFPRDLSHLTPGSDGDAATIFHSWNIHYAFLLHTVMDTAMDAKPASYSSIIECDRKIRDFHVPAQWRIPLGDETLPTPPDVAMYRWMTLSAKETALLHLHRAYFAQSLQEAPADLQRHRYLPSVVAIYKSACRLIHGLAITWMSIPKFLARVSLAWSHGLSAAIVACLLVTRAPTSHLTAAALEELDNITSLFDSSSSACQPAAKLLSSVQSLRRKAHEVLGRPYTRFHHFDEPPLAIAISELDRLNGKTHSFSFADHSSSTMPAAASSSSIPFYEPRSPATSITISDFAEGHPPFLRDSSTASYNLHPSLAHDVHDFSTRSAQGTHPTPQMTFFDYPSDAAASLMESSLAPLHEPVLQPPREMPPDQGRFFQPYQPHSHRTDPPVQHPTIQPMQYFNEAMQQETSTFFDQRRSTPANFEPPFGGSVPSGFQSGTFPSGFTAGFYSSPFVLDSSWNSLVEQLGF